MALWMPMNQRGPYRFWRSPPEANANPDGKCCFLPRKPQIPEQLLLLPPIIWGYQFVAQCPESPSPTASDGRGLTPSR